MLIEYIPKSVQISCGFCAKDSRKNRQVYFIFMFTDTRKLNRN